MISEQNQTENNILIEELEEKHKPTNTGMASKQYFFLQQYFYDTLTIFYSISNNIQWYTFKNISTTLHRLYQHSSQIKMIDFIWKWIYLLRENRKDL